MFVQSINIMQDAEFQRVYIHGYFMNSTSEWPSDPHLIKTEYRHPDKLSGAAEKQLAK